MSAAPTHPQIYAYFRMALATGLLTPQEMIAWTDRELLKVDLPSEELMDLSLSGRQPYSQLIGLLNHMQSWPKDPTPLGLVFARARTKLQQNPERLCSLLQSLLLINAEAHLPGEIRRGLAMLADSLEHHQQGQLSQEELSSRLMAFLECHADLSGLSNPDDLLALGIEIPPKGT